MRSEHLLRFVVVNTLALGLGAAVATSCIKVNYPTVSFRCNPRQGDNCPETHFCCSDDPSTADGELPAYMGRPSGSATPLYADLANAAGTSGMCVNRDDLSPMFALVTNGCPIPCNPTWSSGSIETVCGRTFVCCQTVEVEDKDCVLPEGESQWRPVTGTDIGMDGGPESVSPRTNWNGVAHATHQDPNGSVCLALNGGDPMSAGFSECIRHLTVANQRGFCMSLRPGQGCPTADPLYQDACEIKSGTPPP